MRNPSYGRPKLSALKLGAFFGGVVYADRDLICHYSVGFVTFRVRFS